MVQGGGSGCPAGLGFWVWALGSAADSKAAWKSYRCLALHEDSTYPLEFPLSTLFLKHLEPSTPTSPYPFCEATSGV